MENKEVLSYNKVISAIAALNEAEDALEKSEKEFAEVFMAKKNSNLFLKKHGVDIDRIKDHYTKIDRIEIEDGFDRGLIRMCVVVHSFGETDYYDSSLFNKQELIDFLSADDYYAPILAKEKEEKEIAKLKKEKADKEKRKKLYEELKKEFENG